MDEKTKYLLTIRLPVEAFDDPEARNAAKAILAEMGMEEAGPEVVKLQRVRPDGPPERVAL
jgi:hypothetical protein